MRESKSRTAHVSADETASASPAPRRALPPAARRALAEAEQRRKANEDVSEDRPREIGGRGGKDPARYGDWEVKGRAIDF